jgi:hypothetical protein
MGHANRNRSTSRVSRSSLLRTYKMQQRKRCNFRRWLRWVSDPGAIRKQILMTPSSRYRCGCAILAEHLVENPVFYFCSMCFWAHKYLNEDHLAINFSSCHICISSIPSCSPLVKWAPLRMRHIEVRVSISFQSRSISACMELLLYLCQNLSHQLPTMEITRAI